MASISRQSVALSAGRIRGRRVGSTAAATAALVGLLLGGAACSRDDGSPVRAPASAPPSVEAAPVSDASTDAPIAVGSVPRIRDATQARAISAGDGEYPVWASARSVRGDAVAVSQSLPDAVQIGGGRVWVPWPEYPTDADANAPVQFSGVQSALSDDVRAGARHVVSQRAAWASVPRYLPDAQEAFAQGAPVARRRAGTDEAWELVVDPSGHAQATHLTSDRTAAYDHVSLCPPHPTPEALGLTSPEPTDGADADPAGDHLAAAVESFIVGMRSPLGRPMHSWGTTVNEAAKLLVYSPGEPMELALGGHSLTDLGFYPGDWSAPALEWLTAQAALGAVTDSNVGHAAVSVGPQTLWEACADLATITPGVYTSTDRTRQLESLWSRGLRLEFTSPPLQRAWVADVSAAGHALAVVCHLPGRSFLVDASSGDRLDGGVAQPAQVEAMWLTWSRLSYRVLRSALFDGACGDTSQGGAFDRALTWLGQARDDHAAEIDWTRPNAWGSGVRNQWIAVRRWVAVPANQVWVALRDNAWHQRLWCASGIPVGSISGTEFRRPDLRPHCTDEQFAAMSRAAASAPTVTSELSATDWQPGDSWYQRMYASPFKSLEQILGCAPEPEAISEALARPVETRPKRPWPPGSLSSGISTVSTSTASTAYPRPMPPCPAAGWPPQTDRYWWPAASPLADSGPASTGEVSR